MNKHLSFFLRVILFSLILAVLIVETNRILTPKKYFDDVWATTSTYKGFYDLDENTVDLIGLGSSHIASSLCPQVMFDTAGVRAYNLGCEQQSLLVSYYWLKEALRFQKPKAVVLDAYMLFSYAPSEPLNSEEPCTRMAMDPMRWSPVKWEAVSAISELDAKQSLSSYLFPNVRYHTRWKGLSETDFRFRTMEKHTELKGWTPLSDRGVATDDYMLLPKEMPDEADTMVPLMESYLDRIAALCKEQGIELVLIKTPTINWDAAKHRTMTAYAEKSGVTFLDFNEMAYANAAGFVWKDDMSDDGHTNIWGAEKLSAFLAKELSGVIGRADVSDTQSRRWAESKDYYDRICADCALRHVTDLSEYLSLLSDSRYTVFVAVHTDAVFCTDDAVRAGFAGLGFELPEEENAGYCGVRIDGTVRQQSGRQALSQIGSLRDGYVDYALSSQGLYAGEGCAIRINNIDYAKNRKGINIVVYCNETWKQIDSALYDGSLSRPVEIRPLW